MATGWYVLIAAFVLAFWRIGKERLDRKRKARAAAEAAREPWPEPLPRKQDSEPLA